MSNKWQQCNRRQQHRAHDGGKQKCAVICDKDEAGHGGIWGCFSGEERTDGSDAMVVDRGSTALCLCICQTQTQSRAE